MLARFRTYCDREDMHPLFVLFMFLTFAYCVGVIVAFPVALVIHVLLSP